jgi:hypothetical protein
MSSSWKYVTTIPDGEKFKIKGINIWQCEWKPTGEKIDVLDPLYGKSHKIEVFEICMYNVIIRFAAGEFSCCMWGIYLEKQPVLNFLFKIKKK